MALVSPSTESLRPNVEQSDVEMPSISSTTPPPKLSSTMDSSSAITPDAVSIQSPNPNPNPNPSNPGLVMYSNSSIGLIQSPSVVTPPAAPSFTPSFRPLGAPISQYSAYQNPSLQPPGIVPNSMIMGSIYNVPPGMPLSSTPLSYGSNGYLSMHGPASHVIPPPGVPRYPGSYSSMIRPGFPMHPMSMVGMMPQIPRLSVPGVRPISPMVTSMIRPGIPIITPAEKPQTTVYVGKIAQSVDNDFLLSLLRICGPVKSWKRPQDPSDGKPKGFGFCEFEAAEGVLRALRLLSRLNIDGQEIALNINEATREYLERYVEKKTEREKEKLKELLEAAEGVSPETGIPDSAINEAKLEEDSGEKENVDVHKFGIVSDEDREADKDALAKVTNMIKERVEANPLPPPPPIPALADGPTKSNSEAISRSKDGDSEIDIVKTDIVEERNDEETTSKNKHESPERRRHDRRSRERDRDLDLKRDKERELERFERERERERVRRERDRDIRIREADRLYKERVKDWEAREREKEYQRQHEKDREKERQRERRKEILGFGEGSDDEDVDLRKRRRRSNMIEERRRKRLREREEDLIDRLNEEEEIVETKKRIEEEQKSKKILEPVLSQVIKGIEKPTINEMIVEEDEATFQHTQDIFSDTFDNGVYGTDVSEGMASLASLPPEMKQNDSQVRKLGFGLMGSGKRAAVLSVFHQEDEEDKGEKKMRPLVPIDYSTDELQAVKAGNVTAPASNIAAAAEFAKRISTNPKDEKNEFERERSGRSSDRLSRRDRDRIEAKEKMNARTAENKKLLDAKQLIDMIPKTKDELFSYDINWSIYDKHSLHERMRPWISKKITEFLGEEEETLVDYIVSSTKEHVKASKMLELLQSILDDEAEMFVLKMWRMLIFEVKKVEIGLPLKSKT